MLLAPFVIKQKLFLEGFLDQGTGYFSAMIFLRLHQRGRCLKCIQSRTGIPVGRPDNGCHGFRFDLKG